MGCLEFFLLLFFWWGLLGAYDFSMKKLKKYTTQNVRVHDTINLTIKEEKTNLFIHDYGEKRDIHYLNTNTFSHF